MSGQAAQPNINLVQVGSLPINLPPLPTQRKIASILSAYDDLIENNLKRIKLLEEMAQITYEEWFIKFKVNGEKLKMKNGLPVGWEETRIESLLDKIPTTKKIPSSEFNDTGLVPIIDQSTDFIAGYTNDTDACIKESLPLIVFGDHTRILKFINFPFARGADGTQIILSNNKRMPQHLFYHALRNVDLSNYHYARHFKFLKDLKVFLPDEETANNYEGFAFPIFEMIKKLRKQNRLLKEARDILLPRLMTGMIVV